VFESFSPQQRGKLPGKMKPFAQPIPGRGR
jgi:hypothetical protein